ncbi:restriction endonuclease subunit S [Weissella paramesenteroides]|uniref:restriction endonuclease subunit S n=1 Tax=Weissella paramesenteroides TaxID=1249 RepID=UPI001C1FD101|nr:restriction endonuclease subunit S [Weissella paramesenteroides]MBU7556405.1 restriction endonuclease subunit S [Weissella paramesenteroides]
MRFKTIKLGDVGNGMYGVAEPAINFDDKLPTYLRITDINPDGSINRAGLKSVQPQKKQYHLQDNDIVFARTGNSVGKSYYYDKRDGDFVFAGFLIKFSLHETEYFYPRYLKYFVTTKKYWGWVNSISNGSTRGNINAKMFANMPIDLPTKAKQIRLVHALDLLESKIRINREINDNLAA